MTSAQVEYLKYLEGKRHNLEGEKETERHDVASEKANTTSAVGSVLRGVGLGSALSLIGGGVGKLIRQKQQASYNAKQVDRIAKAFGENQSSRSGPTAGGIGLAGTIIGMTVAMAAVKGLKDAEKVAEAITEGAKATGFTEEQWNQLRPMDRRYIGDGYSRGGVDEVISRMRKMQDKLTNQGGRNK